AVAALAGAPPATARTPRRGGALKHIGLDATTFDVQVGGPETQMMSSLVRRGLFRARSAPPRASEPAVAPRLALRATASAHGRAGTLVRRRGVRWEDRARVHGREVIAADVRYTLERALKRPPTAALLGPLEEIAAPDPHTLRIRLAEPFAPLI